MAIGLAHVENFLGGESDPSIAREASECPCVTMNQRTISAKRKICTIRVSSEIFHVQTRFEVKNERMSLRI